MGSIKKDAAAVDVSKDDSFDELTAQNINAISSVIESNSETLDLLTSKVTSLACHVTSIEALLSEVIKITGVNLAEVNSNIRARVKAVDGDVASSNVVIDIAAALACPVVYR